MARRVDARGRRSRPSPIASSPTARSRDAFEPLRLPHPLGAPPVRAADRVPQGDRIAPVHARRPRTSSTGSACCGCSARRSRSSPNGARPRNRRDGVHRRPSRARARGAGIRRPRAGAREPGARRELAAAGIELAVGDLRDRRPLRPRPSPASTSSTTSRRSTGRRASSTEAYRAVNATAVGDARRSRGRAGVRRVVHCSTVGVHGDVEHPPANEDAPLRPGDVYQVTKLEGERLAREAGDRLGIEVTIARPDRHLRTRRPAPAEAVSRRRRAALSDAWAAARSITISPTSTISSTASDSAASIRPRPTAPTSSPAAR